MFSRQELDGRRSLLERSLADDVSIRLHLLQIFPMTAPIGKLKPEELLRSFDLQAGIDRDRV
jgi:hypothetical protein